ncbi:MAG: acyl carrier protein, partial [Planctomycetota bacterium]
ELLRAAVTQAAVMSVNWSDLLRNAGGRIPALLREVAADVEVAVASDSAEDRAFRDDLLKMGTEQRRTALVAFFNQQLSKIMGMDPDDIDIVQPLNAMGLDSLMAIELKNKIERRLQTTLPMSAFLHDPSVSSLADYLAENYGKDPGETEEAPTKPAESRVAASVRGHAAKNTRVDAAEEPAPKPTSPTTQTTSK